MNYRFSPIEIKELLISWIALSIIFSVPQILRGELIMIFLIMPTLGLGFILHELGHKFVAQNYGFLSEYRMDDGSLYFAFFLILMTTLMGMPLVFAAPGAVVIYPVSTFGRTATVGQMGRIGLAGPVMNLMLCGLFALLFSVVKGNFLVSLAFIGSYVNAFLALFNLLPFGPLDGVKVFRWDKKVWLAAVVLALVGMSLVF